MPIDNNSSAMNCLRILFSQVRRDVNFDALLNTELIRNSSDSEDGELSVLIRLSSQQKLDPVQLDDISKAAAEFTGPALVRLPGRNWVLIQNIRQAAEDFAIVIESVPDRPARALRVKSDEIRNKFGGAVIVFRNLQEIDSARQSAAANGCRIFGTETAFDAPIVRQVKRAPVAVVVAGLVGEAVGA